MHGSRTPDMRLQEAVGLVEALGEEVVLSQTINLTKQTPKTYLGGGQVERLAEDVIAHELTVVLVNANLSPTQQRNLELACQCKVVDRTGIILAIFASRARTKAGQLQVELASLNYQQSRLVRTWTHLERQRGGLGKTGGPGERQLEIDRRLLRDRMVHIKKQLQHVEKERGLQRQARAKHDIPVVALVGYTNAGKSTLFNALVGDESVAQDQVFATLDPLMRQLKLPSGRVVVLADTVGFIADLPHELVEAFHATLEEVAAADLLLHVQDASAADRTAQAKDVINVLEQIEAHQLPRLRVLNKIDCVSKDSLDEGIQVSAMTGEGVPALTVYIEEALSKDWVTKEIRLPVAAGKQVAWLHQHATVLEKHLAEDTWHIQVRIAPHLLNLFEKIA